MVPESYFYSFAIKKPENEIIYPKPNIHNIQNISITSETKYIYPETSKRSETNIYVIQNQTNIDIL